MWNRGYKGRHAAERQGLAAPVVDIKNDEQYEIVVDSSAADDDSFDLLEQALSA